MVKQEEFDALPEEEKRIQRFREYFEMAKIMLDVMPKKATLSCSCAFLGGTSQNKVEIAKNTLISLGFTEYDGKTGDFIIIDSETQVGRSCVKLTKIFKKYKNLSFIIFNNCEKLLSDYNTAMIIKHVTVDSEYGYDEPIIGGRDFISRIVLLGNTDTTDKLYREHNVVFSALTEWI